jgi:hypothetical protein
MYLDIFQSPEVIRIQLAICVSMIIKQDFPHRWPEVVDKVSIYLQMPEPAVWPGALACLYQVNVFTMFGHGLH